jgi:hypothetical protein
VESSEHAARPSALRAVGNYWPGQLARSSVLGNLLEAHSGDLNGIRCLAPVLFTFRRSQMLEHVRKVVPLTEIDAMVSQDRIRRDHVKIELRQRPIAQILRAG